MARIVRVWIQEEICCAHGLCVGECPEVFSLAKGAFESAKIRPEAQNYYVSHAAEIRSAANVCPVRCIHIEEQR